jgi:hypothetical protein
MAVNFQIPKGNQPKSLQTLATGFGLPLVQSAIINANIKQNEADKVEYYSQTLKTPIYDSFLLLKPQGWTSYNYDLNTESFIETNESAKLMDEGNGGILIEGCIIEVTQTKNIVTTLVSGYDGGSIKEYIGAGDYQIVLRGFLQTDYPDLYPTDSIKMLKSYLDAPINLQFESQFLKMMLPADYDLVCSSYNFFQQQGLRNVQYFEINFISDGNFELVKL